MECRSGRDNDEQRNQMRKAHPYQRIGADSAQFRPGPARADVERLDVAAVLFFHLLPGLPEEQVGADCRPENRYQRHRVRLVEGEVRNQRAIECRAQRHIGHEHHPDIGKQRERGPLEHPGIDRIGQEYLEQDANHPKGDREAHHRPRHDQSQHFAHRAKVCPQIDDIGNQQQDHHRPQQPDRIVLAQVLGDPHAGGRPDPRADRLDRGEQRKAEEHRPGQAIAELRPDLTVGADPRGIIVSRASDKPRPQHFKRRTLGLAGPAHGRLNALMARRTRASASSRGRPGGTTSTIR